MKVFNPRDLNGQPQTAFIEATRQAHMRFGVFPEFVGLALRGSLTKGYSTEGSDVDAIMLWDSFLSSQKLALQELAQADFKFMVDGTPTVNLQAEDINVAVILEDVMYYPSKLSNIFRPVTGKKVDLYRKYWAIHLAGLPESERQIIIRGMAISLARDDLLGWSKMVERVSSVPGPQDYRRHRLELWLGRLDHFLAEQ